MRLRRCLTAGAATVTLAATVTGTAQPKGHLSMTARQLPGKQGRMLVTVRAQERLSGLRLVVVSPRVPVMDVVSAMTQGGASAYLRTVEIPRDGFARRMTRIGAYTWRAQVTLKRPGLWRLVIPNWSLQGYAMPLPLVRTVRVPG